MQIYHSDINFQIYEKIVFLCWGINQIQRFIDVDGEKKEMLINVCLFVRTKVAYGGGCFVQAPGAGLTKLRGSSDYNYLLSSTPSVSV